MNFSFVTPLLGFLILNMALCANREVAHKDHVRKAWHAHGRVLWWMNHKGRTRKKVLLAWNETRCKAFHVHLCQVLKHEVHRKKKGLYRPLPILNEPWENVSMDVMTQLPKCNRMDAVSCGSWLIIQVGEIGSNQDNRDNFQLGKIVL